MSWYSNSSYLSWPDSETTSKTESTRQNVWNAGNQKEVMCGIKTEANLDKNNAKNFKPA